MKKQYKLSALLCALLIFALLLSACGGKDGKESDSEDNEPKTYHLLTHAIEKSEFDGAEDYETTLDYDLDNSKVTIKREQTTPDAGIGDGWFPTLDISTLDLAFLPEDFYTHPDILSTWDEAVIFAYSPLVLNSVITTLQYDEYVDPLDVGTNELASSTVYNFVVEDGILRTVKDGDGNTVYGYTYNTDGTLSKITNNGEDYIVYTYDDNATLTKLTRNYVTLFTSTYTYDNDNTLSGFTVSYTYPDTDSTEEEPYTTQYDATGKLTQLTYAGAMDSGYVSDFDFTYEDGALTSATGFQGLPFYTFSLTRETVQK